MKLPQLPKTEAQSLLGQALLGAKDHGSLRLRGIALGFRVS